MSKEAKIGHSSGGKEVYCTKLKLSDTGFLWVEFNFYKIFNFAFENFKPVDIGYTTMSFPRIQSSSQQQQQQQQQQQNVGMISVAQSSQMQTMGSLQTSQNGNSSVGIVGIVSSEEQQQQQQQEQKEHILSSGNGGMIHNGNEIEVEVEEIEGGNRNNNQNNQNNNNNHNNIQNNQNNNNIIIKEDCRYPSIPLPEIQDNNLLVYGQMNQVNSGNAAGGEVEVETKSEGPKIGGSNQEENDALRNLFLLSKNEPQKNGVPASNNGSVPPSDLKK